MLLAQETTNSSGDPGGPTEETKSFPGLCHGQSLAGLQQLNVLQLQQQLWSHPEFPAQLWEN